MNKKGSLFAEAAVVFPVVIMTVMTVIYILINLYIDASAAAKGHLALRQEAGEKTETVLRTDEYRGSIPDDKIGRSPFLKQPDITENFKWSGRVLESDEGRVYLLDERSYIWKSDLIKGEL